MSQPQNLKGRVVVITGGVSGIGRATALELASRGATVLVGDLRAEHADDELVAQVAQVLECDVRREADVANLIGRAEQQFGRLDVLVNNAGLTLVRDITEVTEAEWDACLDTNLKGAFFGCKHAIAVMRRQGGGAIVNVASNAGLLPRWHDPVYSLSKGALLALTRGLALSHSVDRVRVNAVCPGPVGDTEIMNADLRAAEDPAAFTAQVIGASPLARSWGRMITPQEVAKSIAYLVSDDAVMVTGTALAIDGGKSLGVPPPASELG